MVESRQLIVAMPMPSSEYGATRTIAESGAARRRSQVEAWQVRTKKGAKAPPGHVSVTKPPFPISFVAEVDSTHSIQQQQSSVNSAPSDPIHPSETKLLAETPSIQRRP